MLLRNDIVILGGYSFKCDSPANRQPVLAKKI
jgi:hypothetical protein